MSPNSLTMIAMRRPRAPRDQVADQRRLAGAEEAGDDGGGDAGLVHSGYSDRAGRLDLQRHAGGHEHDAGDGGGDPLVEDAVASA